MLLEGDALTSVMLFIGVRTTELLWKLINSVNSNSCSEKGMLYGICMDFYFSKESLDILRNFLVVLAQSYNSLHFGEVDPVVCYLFSLDICVRF